MTSQQMAWHAQAKPGSPGYRVLQVGREAVPLGVRRHALGDLGHSKHHPLGIDIADLQGRPPP
jgi:hypothetical protein